MRWTQYVAVVATVAFVGWLSTIWPGSDWVVAAFLVTAVLMGSLVRRYGRRNRWRRLANVPPEALPEHVDRLPPSEAAAARLILGITFTPERLAALPRHASFQLRPDSRSLNTYLFWLCLVSAALMLLPVARGLDFEDAIIWGILSGICLLGAGGYWLLDTEVGGTLDVTPEGVAVNRPYRAPLAMSWLEVASVKAVTPLPGLTILVLISRARRTVAINSSMPRFTEAAELILGKLAAIYGAT